MNRFLITLMSKKKYVLSQIKDGDHGGEPIGSMRPFFVARGPAFKRNYTTSPNAIVNSVDIYNLMCFILDLVPGPNNGSFENVKDLIKPIYFKEKLIIYIKDIITPSYLKDTRQIVEINPHIGNNLTRLEKQIRQINLELKSLVKIVNNRIRFFILIIVLLAFILIFQLKLSRWPNELEWVSFPRSFTNTKLNYVLTKD